MRERLVADWLSKVGERGGLDVAYCQLLLSQRHKILRAGHGPTEAGKDIITEGPNRKLCAYQVKQGDIDLRAFREIQPQLNELVEAAISHPNVRRGAKHESHLVTSGVFKQPVLSLVSELNASWQRRGFKPLKLIGAKQLHPQFLELAADFWPVDLPEIREFLTLYLAQGRGDLDQEAFSSFLFKLLSGKEWSRKEALRRIAAVNLFASYLLEPFNRSQDYWSSFQGWIIAAAHLLWIAETYQITAKDFGPSFNLARSAALNALGCLSEEALKERALSPREVELDDYTRLRNTISAVAVAAWHLIQVRNGEQSKSFDPATALVRRLASEGRIWYWGESALPHFVTILLFLERMGKLGDAENLLNNLLDAVSIRNAHQAETPLAPPDVGPDDVLADFLAKAKEQRPQRVRSGVYSWSLESLVHLTARRLRRQNLAAKWSQISKVDIAVFKPVRPADLLLWKCENGEEVTRKFGTPQSWRELLAVARADERNTLSRGITTDPDFALMFALAYPHRADRALIKALDSWFA